MDYQASIEKNIFHDSDHDRCKARLDSFYGMVCYEQNLKIIQTIKQQYGKILDVGAGYGSLTALLKEHEYNTVGIEPNKEKRKLAAKWYNVELSDVDIYKTPFKNNEFDCVILREVVFHLDFEKAFKELSRITRSQIIIFQGNAVLTRKIGQILFGHKEFNEKHRNYYIDFLKKTPFNNLTTSFLDIFAFPLSGGFIGTQIIPDSMPILIKIIIKTDKNLNKILKFFNIQKYFCMRFIISATVDNV